MIRCPVCETVQPPGPECQVCGKRFASGPAGGDAPAGTLLELDPTRLPAIRLAEVAPIEGLEANAQLSPEVAVAPLEALDSGRAEDPLPRVAPALGPVTCRYCRNVQATGMLCDLCGMRLPRTTPPVTPSGALAAPEEGFGRCSSCRLPGRLGAHCVECGAPMVA